MAEKYLIVFGENPDKQLKQNSDHLKSVKDASWLYDGLAHGAFGSADEAFQAVFRDEKLAPSAIIDNNKWLSPAVLGNNQDIWKQAVNHCLSLAQPGDIHCYSYSS